MTSAEKLILFCFLFEAVLCQDFSITLPESVEAVRGLCVLIPCSFEINGDYDADLQGDPTGIWLKYGIDLNNNKVLNSKVTKGNKIEGKLIGDLLMKNCTTIFYNITQRDRGEYHFRIEASGRLKYTFYSPSVSLRVGDSPINPSITLYKKDQGEVEDQNEVVEGTSVSLICSAPAPCPFNLPTFSWNFLPEERRQEQNHNTSFSSSQLTFSATHLHHGLNFTCTATYQLQNNNKSAHSSLTLHVLSTSGKKECLTLQLLPGKRNVSLSSYFQEKGMSHSPATSRKKECLTLQLLLGKRNVSLSSYFWEKGMSHSPATSGKKECLSLQLLPGITGQKSPTASILPPQTEESKSPGPHHAHFLQRHHREHPDQLHHCVVRCLQGLI
ncbi:myeloid cell surface antigen CD33-like isoform X2 [Neoarius graeffei]|uniref:myeloid cell surface antigen CD33-like isoform X2 n=1 Tax=Neoarius graeffei TaxID=443677 RepID=UPI00298CA07D|nr:myeloid cell surface antigen CD33-like isoform X2 [Neoarius graeffei]